MLKAYTKNMTKGKNDCFAESLSYVTGIPREGIPNFANHDDFWEAVDSFLYSWKLKMVVYDPLLHSDIDEILCTGYNQRNIKHVVVYKNDELVFDSFPNGGDLKDIEDKWVIIPTYHSYTLEEIDSGC